MAAQGPQMTLGGATRGDAVEAEGLAKGRDSLGHGRAVGLLLLNRPGKHLAVLDGLAKSRLEPCRQPDKILQTQGEEWRQKKVTKRAKHTFGPGTLLRGLGLGGLGRPAASARLSARVLARADASASRSVASVS
jgi:hypothetical protein